MGTCRALDNGEVHLALSCLQGKHSARDRALFVLGLNTGFRISELLSLNIGDVYQYGHVVTRITVQRKNMKGKAQSRSMPVNPAARGALSEYVQLLVDNGYSVDTPLFFVWYRGLRRMTRKQAWATLHNLFTTAQLDGCLGTHTMRKTFARVMFAAVNYRIEKLQKLLGHKWLNTTVQYIANIDEGLDDAVQQTCIGP